jgi:hypothetical protein
MRIELDDDGGSKACDLRFARAARQRRARQEPNGHREHQQDAAGDNDSPSSQADFLVKRGLF